MVDKEFEMAEEPNALDIVAPKKELIEKYNTTPEQAADFVLSSDNPVEEFYQAYKHMNADDAKRLPAAIIEKDTGSKVRKIFLQDEIIGNYDIDADYLKDMSPQAKMWYFGAGIMAGKIMVNEEGGGNTIEETALGDMLIDMYDSNPDMYGNLIEGLPDDQQANFLLTVEHLLPSVAYKVIKKDPIEYAKIYGPMLGRIDELGEHYVSALTRIADIIGNAFEEIVNKDPMKYAGIIKGLIENKDEFNEGFQKVIKDLEGRMKRVTSPYDRGEPVVETLETPESYTTIVSEGTGGVKDISTFKKDIEALEYLVRGKQFQPEEVVEDVDAKLELIRNKLQGKVPEERINEILDKERRKLTEGSEKNKAKQEKMMESLTNAKNEFNNLLGSQSSIGEEEIKAAQDFMEQVAVEAAEAEDNLFRYVRHLKDVKKEEKGKKAAKDIDDAAIKQFISKGNYNEVEQYLGDIVDDDVEYNELKERAIDLRTKLKDASSFIETQKRQGKEGYVTAEQLKKIVGDITGKELSEATVNAINKQSEWTESELKLLMNGLEGQSIKLEKTTGKFKPFTHQTKITRKPGFIYSSLTNPDGFTMYMSYDEKNLPENLKGKAYDDMGKVAYHMQQDTGRGTSKAKKNIIGWSGATPMQFKQKKPDGTEDKKKAIYMHEIQSDIMAHLKSPSEYENLKKKNKLQDTHVKSEHANAVHNYFTDWYKALYNDMIKLAKDDGYDEIWISPSDKVAEFWNQDVSDAWKIVYDKTPQLLYGAQKKKLSNSIPYMGHKKDWNDEVWAIDVNKVPKARIARKLIVLSTRGV